VASAGPYANLHLAPDISHANIPSLCFLQAKCPSCHPTNSVKVEVKAKVWFWSRFMCDCRYQQSSVTLCSKSCTGMCWNVMSAVWQAKTIGSAPSRSWGLPMEMWMRLNLAKLQQILRLNGDFLVLFEFCYHYKGYSLFQIIHWWFSNGGPSSCSSSSLKHN